MLTMHQAFFNMLYDTNFNSPKSLRTQVLIKIVVLKMRNLRHERVDNLPRVTQITRPRSHGLSVSELSPEFLL